MRDSAAHYRTMAKDAEDSAKKAPPGYIRDSFFGLAAAWLVLASEAKKRSGSSV
jgi:hypothetical protein